MDYGEKYWAEGSFEDYLVERKEGEDYEEGLERDSEQGAQDFTYSSTTGEGS